VNDFEVRGAQQFLDLSKALKAAGDKPMRQALTAGMRKAVKPAMKQAQRRLKDGLPYGGRGNAASQTVQVKTGRDPGVSVVVKYGSKRASNAHLANTKGRIRHPVFADGEKPRKDWRWVNQEVPGLKGWFDETYRDAAPEIRKALEKAMEDIAQMIVAQASGTLRKMPWEG
jgi:hypothetical protein